MTKQQRPIHVIAKEIRNDWKKIYFGALPYLDAMYDIDSINEKYGDDSAKSIVTYFLCNATSWRGEVAREIKKELNQLIK
jgi:hypothetical protein